MKDRRGWKPDYRAPDSQPRMLPIFQVFPEGVGTLRRKEPVTASHGICPFFRWGN
jgi:hypothetical protein